jgi:hypothetical protein
MRVAEAGAALVTWVIPLVSAAADALGPAATLLAA